MQKLQSKTDVGEWTDHDLDMLVALGFQVEGRLDDGVNSIAVLTSPEPPTYALLYEGTPYIELHTLFGRRYSAVTTDTPLRVDEFGEHEGRKERPRETVQHRFLESRALLDAHRRLVGELTEVRSAPRPTEGLQGAKQHLVALRGRRSWRDYQSLVALALVFISSIALAAGALAYFGE